MTVKIRLMIFAGLAGLVAALAASLIGQNYTDNAAVAYALPAVIGAAVGAFAGLIASGGMIDSLDEITRVVENVTMGDFDSRARVNSGDEVERLAVALNQMLDRIGALVEKEADRDRMQNQIMELLDIVTAASEGDFTKKAHVTEDTFGSLADSFNLMVEELSNLINRVRTAAEQVSSTTQEILVSTEQMAQGAEDQALQIANTSTAIDEMSVSIQRVSDNADSAAGAARKAVQVAQQGGDIVNRTVERLQKMRSTVQDTAAKIKVLGESSLEIGEIVKVIEDIANRTNLLALNATIEAAKAGEAGRGFAVVADEVRKLAERSSKATNDIATLIQSIQAETSAAVRAMEQGTAEVEQGVAMADESGRALQQIVQVINQASDLIQEISMSAKQQAKASSGIVESMELISRISKQTAAGAQQTSQATTQLGNMSEQLRDSVKMFRLAAM
jgi:twitching motility protein PilJ